MLIEAPATLSKKSQARTKRHDGIELIDLPEGVLASTSELPRTYESQQAIPESIAGFQPDMDPHLRQVLEALEDDAFVDDGLKDDFFGELIADGARGSDEAFDFEFEEDHEGAVDKEEEGNDESTWEGRFAKFKQDHRNEAQSDDGYDSEGQDTIGKLPETSVIGGKRRKRTSDASGYSMSSSSMFRNEALQTLDERFDQMILKQYNEDNDNEEDLSDEDPDTDEAPELITSREDFDSMVKEFLNDFEILGRKMRPKLEGESGVDKLDSLRRAMGRDERVRVEDDDKEENYDDLLLSEDEDKKDRWDCETILTTYSNLENHPRLIRARDQKPVPKVLLDRKTGFPVLAPTKSLENKSTERRVSLRSSSGTEGSDESDSESLTNGHRRTIARPRNEDKEDKKARKTAVKAERQTRRAEKKTTKVQFGAEVKDQMKRIVNKEKRLKKL